MRGQLINACLALLEEANTLDELRDSGGYMVWQRPEELLDEFRQAVAGLKQGEITQPFVSIIGFHLVQVESINYNPKRIYQGFPAEIEQKQNGQKSP